MPSLRALPRNRVHCALPFSVVPETMTKKPRAQAKRPAPAAAAATSRPRQAGLFRRLGAWAVDSLLVGAVLSITLLLGYGLALAQQSDSAAANQWLASQGWFILILAAELIGYFYWYWCKVGQTPGMLIFKLRLQGEDGQLLHGAPAFIRMCTSAFGLGNLLSVMDSRSRAFQDMWADSEMLETGPLQWMRR